MIPVDCIHNRFCPRRLSFEEILSDGDGRICIKEAGLIVVGNEQISSREDTPYIFLRSRHL